MPGAVSRHPAEAGHEHEAQTVAGQLAETARFIRKIATRIADQPGDRAAVEILLHTARRLTDFEGPLEEEAARLRQAAHWIQLGRMLERADAERRTAGKPQRREKRDGGAHLQSVPGAA